MHMCISYICSLINLCLTSFLCCYSFKHRDQNYSIPMVDEEGVFSYIWQ